MVLAQNVRARRISKALAQCGIAREPQDGAGQFVDRTRRYKDAIVIVIDQLRDTRQCRC